MKLNSVQYLRGIAALLVVLTHAVVHPLAISTPWAFRVASSGVTLFFVISGFIMVYVTGTGRFDPVDFFRRRIQRVVPLYWIATIAIAILAAFAPSLLKATRFDWSSLIQSLLFIPHYRANGELVPMLKLGWTLNLEMFFYLVFALLAGLTARSRVVTLTFVLGALATAGQLVDFANPLLHAYTAIHLLSFCIGAWVGLLAIEERLPTFGQPPAILAAVAAAIMLATVWMPTAHLPFQALASALLLIAGIQGEAELPRSRLWLLLGDASYSIYLVHMYMLALILAVWNRLPPVVPHVLVVPTAFVGGTLFGIAVYKLVERPVQRQLTRRKQGATANITPEGLTPA